METTKLEGENSDFISTSSQDEVGVLKRKLRSGEIFEQKEQHNGSNNKRGNAKRHLLAGLHFFILNLILVLRIHTPPQMVNEIPWKLFTDVPGS
jgi:hypothetical protein